MLLFQKAAVCHLFLSKRRLQVINTVENTHRGNDGKRENEGLERKPCRQVAVMSCWKENASYES